MRRTIGIPCVLVLGLVLMIGPAVQAEDAKVAAGIKAAEAWMKLVDQDQFGKAWENTTAFYREVSTRESMVQSLTAYRKALGRMVSRKKTSASYQAVLPFMPEGEYVVIQYASSFEKKKSLVETTIVALDTDGVWRITEYIFK
jgi:hypothetical protein